jgi:hypothetical protein
MRRLVNPIQSETDAFRLTIGFAALAALAGVIGWLTLAWFGVAAFVLLAIPLLVRYAGSPARGRRLPLREAAMSRHRHGAITGHRHVLVVANAALGSEELRRHLQDSGRTTEIDVLAPVLTSRVHLAVTDVDRETGRARRRLARSLRWAREQGFVARGEIGDPSPLTSIEDQLRNFGADEVVVVTSPERAGEWQEQLELERLREELEIPVLCIGA